MVVKWSTWVNRCSTEYWLLTPNTEFFCVVTTTQTDLFTMMHYTLVRMWQSLTMTYSNAAALSTSFEWIFHHNEGLFCCVPGLLQSFLKVRQSYHRAKLKNKDVQLRGNSERYLTITASRKRCFWLGENITELCPMNYNQR